MRNSMASARNDELTNVGVSAETLTLTRQRFDAGVSDNLAVVQSQELVTTAELDYINSVFAHNVSKLGLARAPRLEQRWQAHVEALRRALAQPAFDDAWLDGRGLDLDQTLRIALEPKPEVVVA